jgi:hypothetical protein
LGRTFGASYLKDQEYRPWPPTLLTALAAIGYTIWAALLFGAVWLLYKFGPYLLHAMVKAAVKWITG